MIGERLKELRSNAGLSRRALAEMASLSEVSIRKYEEGSRTPKREQEENLAAALGVTADYLRGKTDDPNTTMVYAEEFFSGVPFKVAGTNNIVVSVRDKDGKIVEKTIAEDKLDALKTVIDAFEEKKDGDPHA